MVTLCNARWRSSSASCSSSTSRPTRLTKCDACVTSRDALCNAQRRALSQGGRASGQGRGALAASKGGAHEKEFSGFQEKSTSDEYLDVVVAILYDLKSVTEQAFIEGLITDRDHLTSLLSKVRSRIEG
eukprot:413447-Prorocentrum_minimum.AAC.1